MQIFFVFKKIMGKACCDTIRAEIEIRAMRKYLETKMYEELKRTLTNRLQLHSYRHTEGDLYLYYGFEWFHVSGGRRGKFTEQFLN
jgi:hypothetical protein